MSATSALGGTLVVLHIFHVLVVPEGLSENSPAVDCWGREYDKSRESPVGTTEGSTLRRCFMAGAARRDSVVPTGLSAHTADHVTQR